MVSGLVIQQFSNDPLAQMPPKHQSGLCYKGQWISYRIWFIPNEINSDK